MRSRRFARGEGALLVALVAVQGAACFREPDVTKMKCTPAKGCPSGHVCASIDGDWRCQPTAGTDAPANPDGPPATFDGASVGPTDGRAESALRDGNGTMDQSSGTVDGRTQDATAIDVPTTAADAPAGATGGSSGAGGAGAGGAGGVTGTGGASGTDGGLVDVPVGRDATPDAALDSPIGTGGVGTGGVTGTGGITGTGGATASGGGPGTGGAGTGGLIGTGGAGTGGAGTGGLIGTGGASTCGQGGSAPANALTVDVDAAQSVVNKELFGVLMERLGRGIVPGLFVGTASAIPNVDGMRKDIIDGFKEAGVGAIQFPGGCAANGYNWSANTNPANDVGTDRFMELCNLVGAEPYITGRPTGADATSNAAWVDYIQGHTGWGLKYFKVGSEVWGCGGSQTEATYETNYTANYDRLKDKGLFLVASGGMVGSWAWDQSLVTNIGSMIDGIELHDYLYFPDTIPSAGFTVDQYYRIVNLANAGQIGPRLDGMVQMLNTYDPANRVKIVIDEWGDWLNDTGDGWAQQGNVMDAISAAEQLHVFIEHANRIQLAGLAQAINVMHSLFLTNTAGLMVKTPTFYIFKMFIPHHTAGAKAAPKTLVSENIVTGAGTFPVLSAGTTVDTTGRVNVSLANVDLENSRTILITLNSSRTSYAVATAQIVTGPAMDSTNNFGQAETVNIQGLPAANYSICGKTLTVTLPPKSVVMLAIDPQ